MAIKKDDTSIATEGMFGYINEPAMQPRKTTKKAAGSSKTESKETQTFSVRLPKETVAKIKAYAKAASGYGDIGKIVDEAINTRVNEGLKGLSRDQKDEYKKHFDYFKSL